MVALWQRQAFEEPLQMRAGSTFVELAVAFAAARRWFLATRQQQQQIEGAYRKVQVVTLVPRQSRCWKPMKGVPLVVLQHLSVSERRAC